MRQQLPKYISLLALTAVALAPTASLGQALPSSPSLGGGMGAIDGTDGGGSCTQRGNDGEGAIDIGSDDCPPDFFECIGEGRPLRYNYTYICVADGDGQQPACKQYHQGTIADDPACS